MARSLKHEGDFKIELYTDSVETEWLRYLSNIAIPRWQVVDKALDRWVDVKMGRDINDLDAERLAKTGRS